MVLRENLIATHLKAIIAHVNLIKHCRAKYNDRSNARISDEDIFRILREKGSVDVFSKSYRAFTTGKSDIHTNEERLFLCTVR